MEPAADRPARLVWRRALAYAVDLALATYILAFLLLAPLAAGHSDRLRLDRSLLTWNRCQRVRSVPAALTAYWGGTTPTSGTICRIWQQGIDSGLSLEFDWTRTSDSDGVHWVTNRSLTLPVDAQGLPVTPLTPQALLGWLILVAGGAAWLRRSGGRTPGKYLLGLQVVAPPGQPAPWLRREALRLWPTLTAALFALVPPTQMIRVTGTPPSLGIVFGLIGGYCALLALWFVLPMIRWRGQMPYDRICGTIVTRYDAGRLSRAFY